MQYLLYHIIVFLNMQFVIFEYNHSHITQNRRLSPRLLCYVRLALYRFEFEVTRPRGTRRGRLSVRRYSAVSTHASARDATSGSITLRAATAFQLTRPRGTRRIYSPVSVLEIRFNSRVREGRDRSTPLASLRRSRFNSRVREGRDAMVCRYFYRKMFQLTRPRGTRRPAGFSPADGAVSTHASARDATADDDGVALRS